MMRRREFLAASMAGIAGADVLAVAMTGCRKRGVRHHTMRCIGCALKRNYQSCYRSSIKGRGWDPALREPGCRFILPTKWMGITKEISSTYV